MKLDEKILKGGEILREYVEIFLEEQGEGNFVNVLACLRDSYVCVPMHDDLPDLLQNGDDLFLPVFSDEYQMNESYSQHFDIVEMQFLDVIHLFDQLDIDVAGIVLDAFSNPFIVEKDLFTYVTTLPSRVENEKTIDDKIKSNEYLDEGSKYYNLNTLEGFKEAEKYYLLAADLGNPQAMCNLGYLYFYGRLGEKDEEKGKQYFELSAAKGNIEANMKLGDFYRDGKFYDKDEMKSFKIYEGLLEVIQERNLVSEYPEVLKRIAEAYYYGLGTTVSYQSAIHYFVDAYRYFALKENEVFYYKQLKSECEEYAETCYEILHDDYSLTPLKEDNFRKLYHALVYIECPEFMERQDLDVSGFIGYGYIDEDKGLMFRVIAPAVLEDVIYITEFVDEEIDIRYIDLLNAEYKNIQYNVDQTFLEECSSYIEDIRETKDIDEDSMLYNMRLVTHLDPYRNIQYPDYVNVTLVKDGLENETIEAVCNSIEESGKITAKLLENPYQDFGVYEGNIIDLRIQTIDHEKCLCAYIYDTSVMN